MNKKAIAGTALCRYDEKEQCYIVESPLFDRVAGVAETASEAAERASRSYERPDPNHI